MPAPDVDAWHRLGIRAGREGNHAQALEWFDRVLGAQPHNAVAACNRGLALEGLGRWEEAFESYELAVTADPGHAPGYFNRGNVERRQNHLQAALADYDRALALRADYPEAHGNRGVVLTDLHRLDEAIASFDRAIALRPDDAEAHGNKAFTLLLKGDYANGWRLHEWRWRMDEAGGGNRLPPLAQPLWLGEEPIAGQTLLLRGEQGLGDILQFCRYAKPVADLGARVVLEAPPALANLLADLEGVSQLVVKGRPLPAFDRHCPLMSLPLAFGTSLDTIPSPAGYLKGDAFKVSEWRRRLGAVRRPLIGLVWSGSVRNKNDRNRSLSLLELLSALPREHSYVSLQKDLRPADAEVLRSRPDIAHYAEDLFDFSDTAALCECLDLLIAVDTSVAHLGGALNLRTWVPLTYNAAWRWLLDREDSPWYASMRLYRQNSPGDWGGVLERLGADLRRL